MALLGKMDLDCCNQIAKETISSSSSNISSSSGCRLEPIP